ncbi:MAG: PepSY domain-containing protein [Bacteriovoracaceae bacterium]
MRRFHRVLSITIALPFLIILLSGIILQLRNVIPFVQPKSVKMERVELMPLKTFEEIISASKVNKEDIDQIIYRPNKFHLALRLKNGHEIQMHPQTGEVLVSSPRYTAFLIELHQGSIWGKLGQYGIILPTALALILLIITGILIYPWKRGLR